MTETASHQLLAFFKAMANESRLRLVALLSERERSVGELAELLDLTEPTVSHHLAVLKAIGLVSVRAEGVVRWHALVPKALARMNRALLEQGTRRTRTGAEARVLETFLDARGALTRIPANRSKRHVVLKWLVRQFEEGRRYKESEVNETIQRRYWDSATLRRELVGHRMLARERSIYWRLPDDQWLNVDAR